jgi:hypothetical protein
VLYLGSVVVALSVVDRLGQPAAFVASVSALVAGPAVAVALTGRPPRLLPVLLLPVYFILFALHASGYDESRWSYSRFGPAAVYLSCQLLAVAMVMAIRRARIV